MIWTAMPSEPAMNAARLDFLIVGTQKGGTTAMDHYLRQNPSVQMGRDEKELHFFDNDGLDWQNPDYGPYHAFFDWSSETCVRGEATPIYMYWPQSVERIRAYNPDIKLVCMLRNPAFRAYSHWRMERLRGKETLPFSLSIREGRERIGTDPASLRVHDYVERGFYRDQVARLLANFARDQILFITSDFFKDSKLPALNQLADFIGAEPFSDVVEKVISPLAAPTPDNPPVTGNSAAPENSPVPEPPPVLEDLAVDDVACLTGIFRDDILQTMALTGLDLSAWLDPDYIESEVRAAP